MALAPVWKRAESLHHFVGPFELKNLHHIRHASSIKHPVIYAIHSLQAQATATMAIAPAAVVRIHFQRHPGCGWIQTN